MKKLSIGLFFSGILTFALLAMMALLISNSGEVHSGKDPVVVDYGPVKIELKDPERKNRKPPEPPKKQEIEPIDKIQSSNNRSENLVKVKFPTLTGVDGSEFKVPYTGVFMDGQNGDAMVVSMIEPRYPRVAAVNGTEGYVSFQFDINEDGSVSDIKVVDSSPKGVFEQEAKRAIAKWKFKAKMENGRAVKQGNMHYTLEFKLS